MKAYLLNEICNLDKITKPLNRVELPKPEIGSGEILIKVLCCGICHTELDEIEGRTPPPKFPVVLGHQVVGVIESCDTDARKFNPGDRVGVAWIYSSCGKCEKCKAGLENLCDHFMATGRDAHGGYAEYMSVSEDFAYSIPSRFNDDQAAPLLCAGAIGYRSLKLTGLENGLALGLTGFGASGHLVLQLARYLYPDSKIYVFARSAEERKFALDLGAAWAGGSEERSPTKAAAIIDTTPVWKPVVDALANLEHGGRLVINAIRKESIDKNKLLELNYEEHLWMEKEIKSVANITRDDVDTFLKLAAKIPIIPNTQIYPFDKVNEAILDLKHKHSTGAKVLKVAQ